MTKKPQRKLLKKAAREKEQKDKEKSESERLKKQQEEAEKQAAEAEAQRTALQAPAGLNGSYNAANKTISASWASNGPGVTYDVSVNGQTQNYATTSITVSGGSPGSSVVIMVVPVKDGKRGSPATTTVAIPADPTPPDTSTNDDTNTNDTPNNDTTTPPPAN
nr:hypothetical protein [Listeria rocourtiae]